MFTELICRTNLCLGLFVFFTLNSFRGLVRFCHPELVSGSCCFVFGRTFTLFNITKMLKQVAHDKRVVFSLTELCNNLFHQKTGQKPRFSCIKQNNYFTEKTTFATAVIFLSIVLESFIPQSETSFESAGVICITPILTEEILPTRLFVAFSIPSARTLASAVAAFNNSAFFLLSSL